MMKFTDKPHYLQHRQRLRERFRTTGFDGFQDYEALELLLTYAIPRMDVKPLAKELISRFGSFSSALDASRDELAEVKGIKENTAVLLSVVKECARLYLKEGLKKKKHITSTRELLDYCKLTMSGLKDEQFMAIFLNSQNEVIADEVIQEGTVNQSVVYPRKVMERAIYHKASSLIVVHNHPGGSSKPSAEDKRLTNQLIGAGRSLGINIHDHLIISKAGHFSFLEAGMM
ncbi:MAG: DNA repair protein RadC [Nitrospirae bacterium]|nr:DNA repair protein RadC [Nitrospirota bacterium]